MVVSWTLGQIHPYIYDIYDTNDGDSMTVMTQVRYEGLNITYMTFQA